MMPTISTRYAQPNSIVQQGDHVIVSKRINPFNTKQSNPLLLRGTVYCTDYLPINQGIPNGDYVDHIYISFPNNIYREILTQGHSIYARLHNGGTVNKYWISKYIAGSDTLEIMLDGDYFGVGRNISIENVVAIMIWHLGYAIEFE